ncbi:hypothetical protein BGZ76_005198 [Entomortierella beljakovae]|nr:hypothetical protein BGZ76_005198 [Entomortierella beljakovae]
MLLFKVAAIFLISTLSVAAPVPQGTDRKALINTAKATTTEIVDIFPEPARSEAKVALKTIFGVEDTAPQVPGLPGLPGK